jgi:hypothetical protein
MSLVKNLNFQEDNKILELNKTLSSNNLSSIKIANLISQEFQI